MHKTLLITDDFPPQVGGVATYHGQLCRHLPPESIAVLTAPVAGNVSSLTTAAGYRVYREPLRTSSVLAWPKWTPALHALKKLQTLQRYEGWWVGQVLPYGTVAWWLSRTMGVPYAVSVHGMDVRIPRGRRRWLCGKILHGAAAIIANSRSTASYLSAYGVRQSQVHVVTPGVSQPTEVPIATLRTVAETYRLEGKRVLLAVGRLVRRKNHAQVLGVLPSLVRQFPDVRYVIAGDGPLRRQLQGNVRRLGLSDAVVFTGAVPSLELAALYDQAEIFVLTPTSGTGGDVEGFGTVFLEANSHGKPVIASAIAGVNEAVADGISGLLVAPGDDRQLREAIARLLLQRSVAHRLGLQGQDRAFTQFRWDSRARQLQDIFS